MPPTKPPQYTQNTSPSTLKSKTPENNEMNFPGTSHHLSNNSNLERNLNTNNQNNGNAFKRHSYSCPHTHHEVGSNCHCSALLNDQNYNCHLNHQQTIVDSPIMPHRLICHQPSSENFTRKKIMGSPVFQKKTMCSTPALKTCHSLPRSATLRTISCENLLSHHPNAKICFGSKSADIKSDFHGTELPYCWPSSLNILTQRPENQHFFDTPEAFEVDLNAQFGSNFCKKIPPINKNLYSPKTKRSKVSNSAASPHGCSRKSRKHAAKKALRELNQQPSPTNWRNLVSTTFKFLPANWKKLISIISMSSTTTKRNLMNIFYKT